CLATHCRQPFGVLHHRGGPGALPDRLYRRPRSAQCRLGAGAHPFNHLVRHSAPQLRAGRGQHRAEGMTADPFLAEARGAYAAANAGTLRWMLARPPLAGAFLNTKLHSVTLREYDAGDGHRAPTYIYGWIQGRGLESLSTHAAFFDAEDPELARALDAAAGPLHGALDRLQARDGHAYFTYDAALSPVYPDKSDVVR